MINNITDQYFKEMLEEKHGIRSRLSAIRQYPSRKFENEQIKEECEVFIIYALTEYDDETAIFNSEANKALLACVENNEYIFTEKGLETLHRFACSEDEAYGKMAQKIHNLYIYNRYKLIDEKNLHSNYKHLTKSTKDRVFAALTCFSIFAKANNIKIPTPLQSIILAKTFR